MGRVFSAIPIDQAHEQNNACSKRDGGAVGLTDNPSALQRWPIAGPEVTALTKDFEDAHQLMGRRHEVIHHDQTANVQNVFRKDVCSLGNVMEELGNPFEEESEDLLVLDSKEIADPSQTKTHDATYILLGGAPIKQMMKPAAAKTFDEYSHIFLLSCAVCHVWTLFGILTRMTP